MAFEEFMKGQITEKLCPYKCQGMLFLIYTNGNVKCRTCKKIPKEEDLLGVY